MKRLASLVGLMLLVTACSGATDTVSKSSTTRPTATPTTVSANTTAPKATSTATSAVPVELEARCSFDQLIPQVLCRASGTVEGSQLRWGSNVGGEETGSSNTSQNLQYEIQFDGSHQIVAQVVVTLQECRGSDCQTVEVVIDTSSIATDPARKATPSGQQGSDSGQKTPTTAAELVRARWGGVCEGAGSQMLSVAPMSPADLDFMSPLGALSGVHPTPVSRQYFFPLENVVADVRAPASGNIIYLSNRGTANTEGSYGGASGQGYEVQYVIEVSCDLFLVVDHVIGVPASIRLALGNRSNAQVRIQVAAGELLGQHTDGFKVDFSVIDLSRGETNGFVRNNSYYQAQYGEAFKLFERDSLEYFDEPLRSQLAKKSLRSASPRGGFFTYDVAGTAQGAWFQEGTNGYRGSTEDVLGAYYVGHLALVPDHIDPSKLRVSIGDEFRGLQMGRQWGVTGDAPSFDTVTTDSGIVTYELRRLVPCDGTPIEIAKARSAAFKCSTEEMGTLQIELLDEQRMRVEVFFTNSPTGNARIYVR